MTNSDDASRILAAICNEHFAHIVSQLEPKSLVPNSMGRPLSTNIATTRPSTPGLDFIHHLHRLYNADNSVFLNGVADLDKSG